MVSSSLITITVLRLREKVAFFELDLEVDLYEYVCARTNLVGDFSVSGSYLAGEEGDGYNL